MITYINRELGYGHLGSGLIVYDRAHFKDGDYEKVAHIREDRRVTYYVELSPDDKDTIEHIAATADPTISQTQDQKVFSTPPKTL